MELNFEHPFQGVIDAVALTHVGFKRLFFSTNIPCSSVFEQDDSVRKFDGTLVVTFSDGEKSIGSLAVTNEELSKMFDCSEGLIASDTPFTACLCGNQGVFSDLDAKITIYLTFNPKSFSGKLNMQMGEAVVTIQSDQPALKVWSEYPAFFFLPVENIPNISQKLQWALRQAGVKFGHEIPTLTKENFLEIRGVGNSYLSELDRFLSENGCSFGAKFTNAERVLFGSKMKGAKLNFYR